MIIIHNISYCFGSYLWRDLLRSLLNSEFTVWALVNIHNIYKITETQQDPSSAIPIIMNPSVTWQEWWELGFIIGRDEIDLRLAESTHGWWILIKIWKVLNYLGLVLWRPKIDEITMKFPVALHYCREAISKRRSKMVLSKVLLWLYEAIVKTIIFYGVFAQYRTLEIFRLAKDLEIVNERFSLPFVMRYGKHNLWQLMLGISWLHRWLVFSSSSMKAIARISYKTQPNLKRNHHQALK